MAQKSKRKTTPSPKKSVRLKVDKTIKLFIDGKFPRTESGRTYIVENTETGKPFAHLCQASRKDLRASVDAARAARSAWAGASAYLRGQILYRMAEMAEGKRLELVDTLVNALGFSDSEAELEVNNAIDAFVYYAGLTDKIQQVYASVNPVASPHHNFTTAEPTGVVGVLFDKEDGLDDIAIQISSILCSGNTLIAVLPEELGALLAPLAEVFATSDLPSGAINLLSGFSDELAGHMASHMEINAMCVQSRDKKLLGEIKEAGVPNMKRITPRFESDLDLKSILRFVEYKTVWHPIGV